jgi:hypothetical protein
VLQKEYLTYIYKDDELLSNSAVILFSLKLANISDVLFVLIKYPSQLPLALSEWTINLNGRRSVLLNAIYPTP